MELVFVEWNDFCNHQYQEYNITGYYVYGNGQTACRFSRADADVRRIPRDEILSKFGTGFPSLTTLESLSKLLEYLVRTRIINGQVRTSKAKSISRTKLRDMLIELGPGYRTSHDCFKNYGFSGWRASISAQCKQIRDDMKSFQGESFVDDVVEELKDHMQLSFQRLKQDTKLFEEAALRAMREVVTDFTLDS